MTDVSNSHACEVCTQIAAKLIAVSAALPPAPSATPGRSAVPETSRPAPVPQRSAVPETPVPPVPSDQQVVPPSRAAQTASQAPTDLAVEMPFDPPSSPLRDATPATVPSREAHSVEAQPSELAAPPAPPQQLAVDMPFDLLPVSPSTDPDWPEPLAQPELTGSPISPAGSRRLRVLLAVGFVGVIVIVAAILVATLVPRGSHKSTTGSATTTSPQPASSSAPASPSASGSASPAGSITAQFATAWATAQLPRNAQILTDQSTQSMLVADGFTSVSAVPTSAASTAPLSPFSYLLVTPEIRQIAETNAAVARALASSMPVAVFGVGAEQVAVRQAVADPADVVIARQAADARTRKAAENELLKNPAMHVSNSAALTALRAGQLDLRAATVLAYMANSSHVDLVNVNINPAEQAAGTPIRSIDISSDAPAAMRTILAGLPVSYQPTSMTTLSSGAVRVVWPIMAEPLPSLN